VGAVAAGGIFGLMALGSLIREVDATGGGCGVAVVGLEMVRIALRAAYVDGLLVVIVGFCSIVRA
jgi:hypothetical protein